MACANPRLAICLSLLFFFLLFLPASVGFGFVELFFKNYAKFTFRKENYFLVRVSRYVKGYYDPDCGWLGDYWTSEWMIYQGSEKTNLRQYQMMLAGGYDSDKDDLSDKVEWCFKEFPAHSSCS